MNIIEVDNLVKKYKGNTIASVDGISFIVKKGEFFSLLGPNGAGKTSTISILTTTLTKTSGKVKIAGYDIEKESRKVREKVGIIFQKPSLDPQLTAEENIRFHACLYGMYSYRPAFKMMPKTYRTRVLELAEMVGIKEQLYKPIKKLSGGMQRKLEIIRSLIHTPVILFLDEPTQGLDAQSRIGLWDYINNIRKTHGTTIFLTTHYINEAENADTVCIINKGKVATCCSPEEIKQSLLRQELLIDATDRAALIKELNTLGLSYTINKHIVIPYVGCAQDIIVKIKSKLHTLQINEPSLEEAYVQFINNTKEKTTYE